MSSHDPVTQLWCMSHVSFFDMNVLPQTQLLWAVMDILHKNKVSFKQRFMLMLYASLNWICRMEWDFQRESKSRNWAGSNVEVQNNATLNSIMVKMKWGWFFYGKCCKTFWFKCAAKVCLKIICTHINYLVSPHYKHCIFYIALSFMVLWNQIVVDRWNQIRWGETGLVSRED